MRKPRVFVGSSTESLDVAFEIQKALEFSCEPTVWTQGVFKLTQSSLASLLHALDEFEYAIFVMTPDDIVTLRDRQQVTARDNVLFELGLFIGRYGAERVFMVQPREYDDFRVPTDLLGITKATYDPRRSDSNLAAALGPACSDIQSAILSSCQPRYPERLVSECQQLEGRFTSALRVQIERAPKPEGFPMPETLEGLDPGRLERILKLLFKDGRFRSPYGTYIQCRLKREEEGEPADQLEELEFRRLLNRFQEKLNEWTGS